jgi:hypothetical protein
MLYHWLWLAWLLAFLPIELPPAIAHRHGGTLSEHCWWAFCWKSYGVGRPLWRTRRAVFLAFWAALTLHFVAGLPAWPWLVVSSVPFAVTFVVATLFERGES